jgi:hypothetical protein
MQQFKKLMLKKCITGIVGLIWVSGLLIAGSDSIYMPWVNGIGLILFFSASIILGKLLQPFDSNESIIISSRLKHRIKLKIFDREEHVY